MTREEIDRQVFALLRRIDLQLRFGSPEEANRLRDQIGALERQKNNLKPERNAP